MRLSKVPKVIQWWMTPKLPPEHIFFSPGKRPKGAGPIFKEYSKRWLIHPIKRRMAKYYLSFLQKFFDISVIGLTGSAGKTSTKEMFASILKQKGEVVVTYKNIDSVYNIPTTILKCRPKTRYLVLEMGIEFPGEMDFYLWLAKPKIAVITNIYPTHTEFLKHVQGVFSEKSKLIKGLPTKGIAVLNKEDVYLRKLGKNLKAKVVWFGKDGLVRAENIRLTSDLNTKYTLAIGRDKISIQLPVLGQQFVYNSLAASVVGHLLGLSLAQIKKGVQEFDVPEHRMRPINLASGALVLDDSYNNNPAAAQEALKTLKMVSPGKKRIVVIGDMLELGENEEKYHRKLGLEVAKLKVDHLIGVGQLSGFLVEEASKKMEKGKAEWVADWKKVVPILRPLLKKDTVCLIKGSRSIGLDRIVSRLS